MSGASKGMFPGSRSRAICLVWGFNVPALDLLRQGSVPSLGCRLQRVAAWDPGKRTRNEMRLTTVGVHDEKHLAPGGRITFREGASIQEDHGRSAQVRGIQKESVDSGRCLDSPKSGLWGKLDAVILGATDSDSNKTGSVCRKACARYICIW